MYDNASYEQLVCEKETAERNKAEAENTKRAIENKIDRLNTVKSTLAGLYESYSGINTSVKKVVDQDYEWKGSNYDSFSNNGSLLVSASKQYYKNIDEARDSINSEITRLENEIHKQILLIGSLVALINTLASKIENFFNSLFD